MEIRTPRLLLRPPRPDDAGSLAGIRRELLEPGGALVVQLVEPRGLVVGLVQYDVQRDPDHPHASLYVRLDPAVHGRGLAVEAIGAVVNALAGAGCPRFVIHPAEENVHAIVAFARVGFRIVGRLRSYERRPDGTLHDCVLMELLARDLAPPGAGPVRRATPADAPRVAELANALDRFVGQPGTAHDLRSALLAIASQTVHVAVEGGRVVGYALSHAAYDTDLARPGVWLEDLFVEQGMRGRGLGLLLLRRVAHEALQEGAASVRWSVRSRNTAARAFYATVGAEEEDDRVLALHGDALERLARNW